jgi:hypothetical protein
MMYTILAPLLLFSNGRDVSWNVSAAVIPFVCVYS